MADDGNVVEMLHVRRRRDELETAGCHLLEACYWLAKLSLVLRDDIDAVAHARLADIHSMLAYTYETGDPMELIRQTDEAISLLTRWRAAVRDVAGSAAAP